jgi:hypothetical protein
MRHVLCMVCVLAVLAGRAGCKQPETSPSAVTPDASAKVGQAGSEATGAASQPAPEAATKPAGEAGTPAEKSAAGAATASPVTVGPGSGDKPLVTVSAYYPDTEAHATIKKLVLGLPAKFGKEVRSEFVDFTSDEGFKIWQAAGMTCGGIQINKEQTCTYTKNGKPTEVTFKMAMGGEWTADDLNAVVKQALADKGKSK